MAIFTWNNSLLDAYSSFAVKFSNLVRSAIAPVTSKSVLHVKFLHFYCQMLSAIHTYNVI